jgi:hypothetical protein
MDLSCSPSPRHRFGADADIPIAGDVAMLRLNPGKPHHQNSDDLKAFSN